MKGGIFKMRHENYVQITNGKILSITLIPVLTVTHPHMSNIWCDSEHWEFPGMHKDDK